MSNFQNKDNTGFLFDKTESKTNDKQPDISGEINIHSIVFSIAGWLKTTEENNEYYMLSAKEKDTDIRDMMPVKSDKRHELKNNTGYLIKNEKENDKQPDLTGEINIANEILSIAAWLRTSAKGNKYYSCIVQNNEKQHQYEDIVSKYIDEKIKRKKPIFKEEVEKTNDKDKPFNTSNVFDSLFEDAADNQNMELTAQLEEELLDLLN